MLTEGLYARQPIFDRRRVVAGYELLYRSIDADRRATGAEATASVLAGAFAGLETRGVDPGVPMFVNLPDELLRGTEILGFSAERLVVEVLEDVRPDPRLSEALETLRTAGFRLALDDFVLDDPRLGLVPAVDIVKVDFLAVGGADRGRLVRALRSHPVRLLAEKVETHAEFAHARSLGFDLYQGYFFAKPEMVAIRRFDEGRARLVRLLAELQDPEIGLDRVARSVEAHPALSYQLLRLLNSAHVGLPVKVASIREAVVLLGARRITDLTAVLVMAAGDAKPRELVSVGLTRGKMCEQVAGHLREPSPASHFTAGVFSVFDALTDVPMAQLVGPLPLEDGVKAALVERSGSVGEVLDAVAGYERGEWDVVDRFPLPASVWSEGYLDALAWADAHLAGLRPRSSPPHPR